jgi:hypothetical protein
VLAEFGGLHAELDYCDPDYWPVGDGRPELAHAREAIARIRGDRAEYRAILAAERFSEPLSSGELVIVYGDYKEMEYAVGLRGSGDELRFFLSLENNYVRGTVTRRGDVHETGRVQNSYGCPACLARNTRIAVPNGFVRARDIRPGMAVWSTDLDGRRTRATVVRVGRTPVPPTHRVVRLILADGRTVLVSPGHPTPSGGVVGRLHRGQAFESSTIVSAQRVPYSGGFTFDLLPSGPTGTYFANGVVLGSTLARDAGIRRLRATG